MRRFEYFGSGSQGKSVPVKTQYQIESELTEMPRFENLRRGIGIITGVGFPSLFLFSGLGDCFCLFGGSLFASAFAV